MLSQSVAHTPRMNPPGGYCAACWISTNASADAVAALFASMPAVKVELAEPAFVHVLFDRNAWAAAHLREEDARACILLALKAAPFAFDFAIGTDVLPPP